MTDPAPVTYTVANGYVTLPVDIDPASLQADQLDFIAQQLPGFVPQEGHLEVILLETFAAMCAQTAQVAAQVPLAIFSYFGTLVGINPLTGAPASSQATFTMVDGQGYTIPAGTVVAYTPTGDTQILFTTAATVAIPAGSTSTAAGAVTLVAETVGVFANGLPIGPVTLVDSLAFVASIAGTTPTAGGADPESQATYLNRLSAQLQLLTPRPILPNDFAQIATQTAGVTRALAIDGLNPARTFTDGVTTTGSPTVTSATAAFITADIGRGITGAGIPASSYVGAVNSGTSIGLSSSATSNTPVNATATATGVTLTLARLTGQIRTVTVAVVGATGLAVSAAVKAATQAALTAAREVNFVVQVTDPTYTSIDVAYHAIAVAGANPATVQTAINAAVTSYLAPSGWAGGTLEPPLWQTGQTLVRYLEIATLINNVQGVDYVTTLTIGVTGNALGTADVTLAGDAPLPTVGALSPNVTTS
jgi:hypothetical protein